MSEGIGELIKVSDFCNRESEVTWLRAIGN